MYPFWETVIAPLITGRRCPADRRDRRAARRDDHADARRARPPTASCTSSTLCRRSTPTSTSAGSPGRYVFHRDLSLDVLDRCGAFDVALIDGDHNWYTVYNELRVLARVGPQRRAIRCPC